MIPGSEDSTVTTVVDHQRFAGFVTGARWVRRRVGTPGHLLAVCASSQAAVGGLVPDREWLQMSDAEAGAELCPLCVQTGDSRTATLQGASNLVQ